MFTCSILMNECDVCECDSRLYTHMSCYVLMYIQYLSKRSNKNLVFKLIPKKIVRTGTGTSFCCCCAQRSKTQHIPTLTNKSRTPVPLAPRPPSSCAVSVVAPYAIPNLLCVVLLAVVFVMFYSSATLRCSVCYFRTTRAISSTASLR